jgi:hypothetical protein
MPLKLRSQPNTVCRSEWEVGRIDQTRGGFKRLGWFCSMIGATATL